MEMNLTHPKFNLEMELLASVPRWPAAVPIQSLVADLKLERQAQVRSLAANLKTRHRVVTEIAHGDNGGNVISIAAKDWPKARTIAESYMAEVYG